MAQLLCIQTTTIFFAKGLGGRDFYRKLWGESVCLLRANILLSDVALQKDLGEFASLCRI